MSINSVDIHFFRRQLLIYYHFRFNTATSLETTPDNVDGTVIDCSMLVMANGKSHVLSNVRCELVS